MNTNRHHRPPTTFKIYYVYVGLPLWTQDQNIGGRGPGPQLGDRFSELVELIAFQKVSNFA